MPDIWIEPPRARALARARVSSPADVEAIERVPFESLMPHWTLYRAIEASAASSPAKPALIALCRSDPLRATRVCSYGELIGMLRATANRLREASRDAPSVVSVATPLVPEAMISLWAGATAGVANPINPYLRPEHVAAIMNAARTTVLVAGGAADGPGIWDHLDELRSLVPTLREIWRVSDGSGSGTFADEIATAPRDRLTFDPLDDPAATAALFHTGGTTAAPKLVRHTHRGQLLNAWCCGAFFGSRVDEVVLCGLPYFHVGGAIVAGLSPVLYGQTVVLAHPDGFRNQRVIAQYWDLVRAHGITRGGSTPTTAAALVVGAAGGRPPTRFSYPVGGSATPRQLGREFEHAFGVPLTEMWGMTELHGALLANPVGVTPRLGSVGFRYPYHRFRSVAPGARQASVPAKAGEVGVLAVSGPCVTPGYLDAAASARLFLDAGFEEPGWLDTGDLCRVDDDGFVWLLGRSKDLIIRGGHNIDPATIEEALLAHPAVLYAAAVGEPDRDKGEIPVAYVQLKPGAVLTEAELAAHCREHVAERAAVPRAVFVVDSMPVTAVGKIFKPALRRDVLERCARRVLADLGLDEAQVTAEVRDQRGSALLVLKVAGDAAGTATRARLRRAFESFQFPLEFETAASS